MVNLFCNPTISTGALLNNFQAIHPKKMTFITPLAEKIQRYHSYARLPFPKICIKAFSL